MATILGVNAKAYRNTNTWASPTWDLIDNIRDLTLNLEKSEADVTTRGGNGFRQRVGTLKDGSVSFQMVWDTGDADFTAIKDAFFNDTSIELAFMDQLINTNGSQGLHADFSVLNFSRSENLEEALLVDVTVAVTKSNNTPEWLVV